MRTGAECAETISVSREASKHCFTSGINKEIKVNGQELETVTSSKPPGSVVSDEGSKPERLLDSIDDSSIDKVETGLERQKRFSKFQDTTDALPCHIRLPVCL